MIKIVKLILFLALVCLLIVGINYFDTETLIILYDYQIRISLFFVIFILIISYCLIYIILKTISTILNIPFTLYKKYTENNLNKEIEYILNSYANIVISSQNDKSKLESFLKNSKYKTHFEVILSAIETSFEKKIIYFSNLSQVKFYEFYSNYNLAKMMIESNNYNQALININRALSYKKNDIVANYLLVDIYYNLGMFNEFADLIKSLDKQGLVRDDKKTIISNYFSLASKSFKDNQESKYFLDQALKYNISNIDAIELICEMNLANKNIEENLAILDAAFSASPSFDIFIIYQNYTDLKAIELYNRLSSLVDSNQYPDLFISIATCLNQTHYVEELLEKYNLQDK